MRQVALFGNCVTHNGYWFWGRPSTEDLWQDLRAVTREIRPDWDLGAPGLRENWEGTAPCTGSTWTARRTTRTSSR